MIADEVRSVGQPALEVVLGDLPDARLALGLDVDVDRRPPLRVGGRVGEGIEDPLLWGVDVPLVEEFVVAGHRLTLSA
jgi:hypothetical protein